MASILALVVTISSLILTIHGQNLGSLFTIQPGNTNGGCGAQTALLNQYAQESLQSVMVAINAINNDGGQNTPNGAKVRRALNTFFKVSQNIGPGANGRTLIATNLVYIRNWLQGTLAGIPQAETYLFCNSDFLVQRAGTAQAQDYQGTGITQNNQPVSIATAYPGRLTGGNVAWWAGDRTTANGYYFTDANSGGNYCNTPGNDGITANLLLVRSTPNGLPTQHAEYSTVVLCPSSFTNAARPNSWTAGSAQIVAGVSLQTVLPKSTTLLHELFHLIHGAGTTGFLEGNDEFYTLAQCTRRGETPNRMRRNAESYVFFVASMYYQFGTEPAIPTNWDFTDRPDQARP